MASSCPTSSRYITTRCLCDIYYTTLHCYEIVQVLYANTDYDVMLLCYVLCMHERKWHPIIVVGSLMSSSRNDLKYK